MNLIFDLGGVVVRWDPAAIIAGVFHDEDFEQESARACSRIRIGWSSTAARWIAKMRSAARRSASAWRKREIRRLLLAVPPSLAPIPETIELLYRLKARGYPLYCLSNMHVASIEHLEREQKFFEVFTGKVISCRLKLCKPEPAIYEQALKANGLDAKDTVFIDDVDVNIEAAAKRRPAHHPVPERRAVRARAARAGRQPLASFSIRAASSLTFAAAARISFQVLSSTGMPSRSRFARVSRSGSPAMRTLVGARRGPALAQPVEELARLAAERVCRCRAAPDRSAIDSMPFSTRCFLLSS